MSVEVTPTQLGFPRQSDLSHTLCVNIATSGSPRLTCAGSAPSSLCFSSKGPLTQLVKRTLSVTNPNTQPIAFKVKTTAPKQYCVRPNSGRMEPGERVDVSVLLQPMKEDPEPGAKCRDKFLVQSIIITPERESMPFPELWSMIEKETRGSISEHKIRCAYLPANSEDSNTQPFPNFASAKSHTHPASPTANNHTNRDDDDDPRYNSVRSHPAVLLNGAQPSPPDLPTNDMPETTVYDPAMDDTFSSRFGPPPTITPPIEVRKARNSTHSHLSSPQPNEIKSSRPPSSILSTSGTKGQMSHSINSSTTDDIQKLKLQLSTALIEIERLKGMISGGDNDGGGIRKRTNAPNGVNQVHSADMMSLNAHGLHGPEGLVPVQTVVLISIGVFAFTWSVY